MDDQLNAWAVTRDPAATRQLMDAWNDPARSIEEIAHRLGLHPDSYKGHRGEVFLFGTPAGEEVFMWEPGPGPYDQAIYDDPSELITADDHPEPWTTAIQRSE